MKREMNKNNKIYKSFDEDRRSCSLSNIKSHHKAVLSLSSITLVVSLIFIMYIVPVDKLRKIVFLELSWFMLILAIITAFSSFFMSNQSSCSSSRYNDKTIYTPKRRELFSKWLYYASIAFLIAGVVLTVIFGYSNIHMS